MQIETFVDECINNADRFQPLPPQDILDINGMSSAKVRCLLRGLCRRPYTRYLEVGCWRGSTLISALHNNPIEFALAIDNFSQFVEPHPRTQEWLYLTNNESRKKPVHPETELRANIREFIPNTKLRLVDGDCFDSKTLDIVEEHQPFDIYFYDGDHSYNSQKLAMQFYERYLSHRAIIVVDDWNASDASQGTVDGLLECGRRIRYRKDLLTPGNCDTGSWWNGIGIIICE